MSPVSDAPGLTQLQSVLEGAGKQVLGVDLPGGGRVLVLPYGARVLGLAFPGNDANVLWTNPALRSVETARAFYGSADWQNSGGDRIWLAPEIDLFFANYPKTGEGEYHQPRQLDPGNYKVAQSDGVIELVNPCVLRFSRSAGESSFEITRRITPADNPVPHSGAQFAGWSQTTQLRFNDAAEGETDEVGLWSLTQLPHGGTMLMPTNGVPEVTTFFGSPVVAREHGRLTWHMSGVGEHKIGVKARSVTGRMGYVYERGDKATLVVRDFRVDSTGRYVDAVWERPEDTGYAVQACSVSSKWGDFSEIEYHAPAIGGRSGVRACTDDSRLWAWQGSARTIDEITAELLGCRG